MSVEGLPDKPHILVVDDDTRLRDLLRIFLARNGYRVTTAADAREARERLQGLDFDLMVLDLMMPGETGLELSRSLRKGKDIPILMLTAMAEPRDRIAGFEHGADDYLAKPFEARELLLRINSILRRVSTPAPAGPEPVRDEVVLGPFRFDLRRGELLRGQNRVRITEAEAGLLRALALNLGRTLSRESLARLLGGNVNARTIDVQVTRLRRKMEPDPGYPRYLQTVRGQGYRLMGE
jgi:two-component system phosphate regulon response regulator OmpR